MSDIRSRVAYLHGLAEGLDLDVSSAEGRVLSSMIDVLGEVADAIDEIVDAQDELADYVEDVDDDLDTLESCVYEGEEGECGCHSDHAVLEQEDGVELASCPDCGETISAGAGELGAELDVTCPVCGCSLVEG